MDYEKKCLKYFIKIRNHVDCRLYYEISYEEIEVYYYYINILKQFLKKCKFNKNNWNLTDIQTSILNSKKEGNYSDIIFKRNFKFLTRLDLKKR